jgi:Cu/Ag efflux pump CusA
VMRSIVAWSVRLRILMLAIAVGVVVLGVTQLPRAPIDALPEFTPPYVEVQTEALGLSAEEVEQFITVPLEADLLNGVAWLDSIESESVTGLSSILLTFDPGTDPIRARQMVAERLTQAHALPNVSRPPTMLQPLSTSNRLMMVSLASEHHSLIEMSVLARWNIRPRLMGVTGVANVSIFGQRERQLQVLVDPMHLRAAGVSLDEILDTVGNALWVSPLTYLEASSPGTGGFIDTPNQRLGVQHLFPIDSPEDLARVSIERDDPNAELMRLGDVAEVVEDHQPLIGDAIVDAGPGLMLVVEKFPNANTLQVTRDVERALDAMGPGLAGIEMDTTVYRPASFIESAIGSFALAIPLGLILLVVVLIALFGDWRAAVVSLLTIPISLIGAALVLYALGMTINIMTLAGFVVAIGIVVDDAVNGVASVLRRSREPATDDPESSRAFDVAESLVGVHGPVIYVTLAIGLAILPLLLIGGVPGGFLPSLLVAYVAAFMVATLVSLTLGSALAFTLLAGHPRQRREPRIVSRLQDAYGAAMVRLIGRTRAAFLAAGAAALAAIVVFTASMVPSIEGSGVPPFRDRDLLIHWDGAAGTSHTEMTRIVGMASSELQGLPGVRNVGAHVGRAIASDQVTGINAGEIWLSIDPDADYDAALGSVREVVDGYPGLRHSVLTYQAQRIDDIIGSPPEDVTVRIFGQDLDLLRSKAAELREAIESISGIGAASVETQIDEPSVQIEVDLAAAERYGVKPGDVRRAAATLLSGIEVGSLFEEQKVFEVVVWGVPELRQSVSDIRDLQIQTPQNGLVSLESLADVRIAPAPTVIRRDAVQRRIDVTATVAGRDVNAVVADIQSALAEVEFPLETHAEILGHTAARQETLTALLGLTAAAIAGIFLLLQAALASWRLAFLGVVMLPGAVVGGMLAAFATGTPGSLATLMGLLAVLGITLRHLVLLARELEVLKQPFGPALVLRGASQRLAPTLTTMLATAALLVPFVILGDRAGFEFIQPMSLVIIGGIASSVLMSLFIAPALFWTSGFSPEPETVAISVERASEPQAVGAG